MKIRLFAAAMIATSFCLWEQSLHAESLKPQTLTLEEAISTAIENDPWLSKSYSIEQALTAKSDGESRRPNPNFSVSMLNLPTDGFDLDQEPMTQLRAGVSQQFSRGDTLQLQRHYRKKQAAEQPFLRENRRAFVEQKVTEQWLNGYHAFASYQLVMEYRPLFSKLADSIGANYASLVGNARQQDIIRAELELVQLDDRLLALDMDQQRLKAELIQWLLPNELAYANYQHIQFPTQITPVTVSAPQVLTMENHALTQWLAEWSSQHPSMLANQQRLNASDAQIEIEKQQYQPQWGVNASYAMRQDDPLGNSRADFFSVGVSVDIPLLTSSSIDSQVASVVHQSESIRTDSQLIHRELITKGQRAIVSLARLESRRTLYQSSIIPQMTQQSEAALAAYTNDDGNFIDVVLARIAELEARLALLHIDVEYNKNVAALNYVLHQTTEGAIK